MSGIQKTQNQQPPASVAERPARDEGGLPAEIRPIDREAIADVFRRSEPFPHFKIDGFLEPAFAREVSRALPSFEEALALGKSYHRVHENRKVQVTDASIFPDPVGRLNDCLAHPAFLETLTAITGIEDLLADPQLKGGGMHVMGPGARLDVHVDFNRIGDRGVHRRLNILVFLNEKWSSRWGGELELWDPEVKRRHVAIEPLFNRCAVFATSEQSFHGVRRIRCPRGHARRSFAAYYYTRQAPSGWDGEKHGTVFRNRPGEEWRGALLVPAEQASRAVRRGLRRVRRGLRGAG